MTPQAMAACAADTNSRGAGETLALEAPSPPRMSADGSDVVMRLEGLHSPQPTLDVSMGVDRSPMLAACSDSTVPPEPRVDTPSPMANTHNLSSDATIAETTAHSRFAVLSAAERHAKLKALRVRCYLRRLRLPASSLHRPRTCAEMGAHTSATA